MPDQGSASALQGYSGYDGTDNFNFCRVPCPNGNPCGGVLGNCDRDSGELGQSMIHGAGLKYFAEVARTGSIAAASQNLHVAISAISRQIARLEQEIGGPLFRRMPRGMVLTKSGEIFAEHVRRTLLEADTILAEISTAHAQGRGIVRIGFAPDCAHSLVPTVLANFRREYPSVRFVVREQLPAVIEQWVTSGEMDLGLFYSTGDLPAVRTLFKAREPICALYRADHPLAPRPSLALADVLAYPLILPDRGTMVRELFDQCCAAHDKSVEPVLLTTSASASREFALLTDGIIVSSRMLLSWATLQGMGEQDDLVACAIDEPLLSERHLRLVAMEGRRLPASVDRFGDALKRALSTIRDALPRQACAGSQAMRAGGLGDP